MLSIKAKNKVLKDIKKVEDLITAQLSVKKYRECPLYQDVIDTHIFGISKEIELAIELNLFSKDYGKNLLEELENKIEEIYNKIEKKKVN